MHRMSFKSSVNLRTVAVLGMALSMISLAAHFFLARYYGGRKVTYDVQSILTWRDSSRMGIDLDIEPLNTKPWRPVKALLSLRPFASARHPYPAPIDSPSGYLFAEIRGEFHEIRSSICDLVVVARLLNLTLIIPKLREVNDAKGISAKFKGSGFDYIYDTQHFISALANDVHILQKLPDKFRLLRKNGIIQMKYPSTAASVDYYLQNILPSVSQHGVVGLIISGGGCLQSLLPANYGDYQRLRCRVAYHALEFRQQVRELGKRMVQRLKASGPYMVLHFGLERETLAYHGCAERFQDVHTELIQYKRSKMIKAGIVQGNLDVDSEMRWLNGSCPLMPDEVALLLKALGYKRSTRLYLSGVETFGGQRVLLPLRSVYPNLEDRTTVSSEDERMKIYGPEESLPPSPPPFKRRSTVDEERARIEAWKKSGPRPRPLPPPAARPKYPHELDGWWGWVGEDDVEPPPSPRQLRLRGHKLLWQALDYVICVEADAFFPAFDRDRYGLPDFASLVMGHRLYSSSSLRTYRPRRGMLAKMLLQARKGDGSKLMGRMRNELVKSMSDVDGDGDGDGDDDDYVKAYPLPECMCRVGDVNESSKEERCPEWMKKGNEEEGDDGVDDVGDDVGEDDVSSSSFFNSSSLSSTSSSGVYNMMTTEGEVDDENDPND